MGVNGLDIQMPRLPVSVVVFRKQRDARVLLCTDGAYYSYSGVLKTEEGR
jgi:hypothetical protein